MRKLSRTREDLSLVNAAVTLDVDGKRVGAARIALGAVAPTPIRAGAAEALLSGAEVTPELLDRVAGAVKDEVSPITDHRASADYRREMSGVLVRRLVEQCFFRGEP
jgi:carbon-monoxide dehydrogenase medium subunit